MEKAKLTIAQKIQLVISLVLRVSLLIGAGGALYLGAWITLFLAIFAFVLTFLPAFFSRNSRVLLPTEMEFTFVLFIYASIFLGTTHGFYERYWWWDVALHGVSGFTLGFIGFILLFVLYSGERIKASAFTIAFFSFCFAVAVGVMWEILEFTLDSFLHTAHKLQLSLSDTMWDLIMDATGALVTSIFGYLYVKHDKENFVTIFLENFIKKNPGLFRNS